MNGMRSGFYTRVLAYICVRILLYICVLILKHVSTCVLAYLFCGNQTKSSISHYAAHCLSLSLSVCLSLSISLSLGVCVCVCGVCVFSQLMSRWLLRLYQGTHTHTHTHTHTCVCVCVHMCVCECVVWVCVCALPLCPSMRTQIPILLLHEDTPIEAANIAWGHK